jgi:transposase InsO family protein
MDFVGPLTESQGFKNILVIMDRFSGFLLCFRLPEKYSAIHAADTFLHTFYGRYGLPETIISDRDSRFTGKFWQTLQKTMGIEFLMSTAFHQETNGQVERTNKTIMQMLRIYANSPGSNWAGNLWRVEYAHNTAKATWHDKSQFEMVHGHPPIEIPLATPRKPTTRGRTVPRSHGYASKDSQ